MGGVAMLNLTLVGLPTDKAAKPLGTNDPVIQVHVAVFDSTHVAANQPTHIIGSVGRLRRIKARVKSALCVALLNRPPVPACDSTGVVIGVYRTDVGAALINGSAVLPGDTARVSAAAPGIQRGDAHGG